MYVYYILFSLSHRNATAVIFDADGSVPKKDAQGKAINPGVPQAAGLRLFPYALGVRQGKMRDELVKVYNDPTFMMIPRGHDDTLKKYAKAVVFEWTPDAKNPEQKSTEWPLLHDRLKEPRQVYTMPTALNELAQEIVEVVDKRLPSR